MRALITLTIAILISSMAVTAQETMYIHRSTGGIIELPVNNIDSIVFYKPVDTTTQILELIGEYEMAYGPHALAIKDNFVFACRDDDIFVVDISNVTLPEAVTTINDLENANTFESLLVQGNTLYAGCASSAGVYVIDITDPTIPVILNKYIGEIYTGNTLHTFALFYENGTLWAAGSNGLNGMLVKYTVTGNTLAVDNYWVATGSGNVAGGVWANATNAFISTADGNIYSFNTADISSGSVGTYTFTAEPGHEHWGRTLVGNGNNLYWADWGAGFIDVNISDPANMIANNLITHSSYTTQHPQAEGTDLYDIVLDTGTGKIFAANGWSGLLQIDVGSTDLVEDYIDYNEHQYYCIALYGNYVVVGNIAAGISGIKGLKIIKVAE